MKLTGSLPLTGYRILGNFAIILTLQPSTILPIPWRIREYLSPLDFELADVPRCQRRAQSTALLPSSPQPTRALPSSSSLSFLYQPGSALAAL